MREGRKYALQVTVGSQQLPDFDEQMINSATSIWICGVNNPTERELARQKFGLSSGAENALARVVTGPKPDGAPILALFRIKGEAAHEHVLINTVGPRESWAYSTTQQNATLRNRLTAKLGEREARRRLSRLYPQGSAEAVIKARARALAQDTEVDLEESDDGAIDGIVNEIVAGTHQGMDGLQDMDQAGH